MDALGKLREEYVRSLPQKRETIRITLSSAAHALRSGTEPDWKALHVVVHRFAGSSGTYGFLELSEHARELEDRIASGTIERLHPDESLACIENWFLKLSRLIDAVQEGSAKGEAA